MVHFRTLSLLGLIPFLLLTEERPVEADGGSSAPGAAAVSPAPVVLDDTVACVQQPDPPPADKPPAEPQAPPKAPDAAPAAPEPKKPLLKTPVVPPLGAAGRSRVKSDETQDSDHFVPVPDRWRLGFPDWKRYRGGLGAPYKRGRWWDPYNQNVLKGDYPIRGQNLFLDLSLTSDTFVDNRRLPTPSGISAARAGSYEFFGRGQQVLVDQTFFLSAELFHGDTAFKPKDWAFRATPAFNINHLRARETGVVNVDVREGTERTNTLIGFQELFGEYKLFDLSPNYDFLSVRAGIQGFNSDFRGFLFFDNQSGLRVFGNARANRNQFNAAYFRPLEKDTYSRLNRSFDDREQDVFVANYFRQDFLRPGYTGQFVAAYNHDHASVHYNRNGVQTRPALIGVAKPHDVRVGYLGFNGDGHLGRINITNSFYWAFGRDSMNPLAGRSVDINAHMAAIELSYDKDWMRFRTSFLYASGDDKPRDGKGRGFDAIFDNPLFAGGGFSFWQSQGIRLTGTGVDLVGEGSLLPTLRSSKLEGQANFVNPGLMLFNLGMDADLTPKWRATANVNFLKFHRTQPLELVLNQANINTGIGMDYSIGFRHRPFLNENVVVVFGASALAPGRGFRDIYQNKTLYSAFAKMTLAF